MIGEINIYGFYLPCGLLMFVASTILVRFISRGLSRFGFYRYVWHPALFDFALVVIVMGMLFLLFSVVG